MKKGLLIVIAVAVVAAATLVATRLAGPRGPKVKDPFTLDYKLDAANIKFFTEGDDMATLLASSPFYVGAQALPGQHTEEFDKARAAKCDEIIADADKLAQDALTLKSDVEKARKALADYLTFCLNNEPKSGRYARAAGKEMLRLLTLEAAAEARYKAIDTSSNNAFTQTYMQFMKTAAAVELAAAYVQDINNILAFAAIGIENLAKNAKFAEANRKLDDAMSDLDGAKGKVDDVMTGMRKVDYGLKQLATGDYYFARTAVAFMRDSMPKLKEAAARLKANQYISAEGVAFTKDYLARFDSLSAEMQKYLDSVPQSELLPVKEANAPCDWAYATHQTPNYYGKAFASVARPAEPPAPQKEGWLAWGWKGVKNAVHGTQSVIGVGVDVLGTAVKNISRVPLGIYYGNTSEEIWEDMKANSNQIIRNWKTNNSGAETMRTANQYINSIDDGAEWVGAKAVEKTIGEGYTSWLTGKVTRAVAGIFTGLGKGITLVGNRQASASDYVIGTIEIASSATGGSKLIIRGSKLPGLVKGLGKGTWISGKRALNAVGEFLENLEKAELEAGIKQALKYGMETAGFNARRAVNQAMLAAIEQSNKALRAEMGRLIDAAIQAGTANFSKTLRESMFDFVKAKFANNIRGLATALANAAGKNPTEFLDNVVGQWVEDALKDLVDEALAEPPLPQELAGLWTGTTTFTSIQVPESTAKQAEKEGCDLGSMIKALEGKPLPTTMRFARSSRTAGSVALVINQPKGGGSPVNARYEYSDGTITINQGVKGGHLTLTGNAVRMTKGYSMSGSITGSAAAGKATIKMSGNFKVTKPY